MSMQIRYYLGPNGISPFERWFESLDAAAAAKVTTALTRIGEGNLASVKSVGLGVLECRIHGGLGIASTLAGRAR